MFRDNPSPSNNFRCFSKTLRLVFVWSSGTEAGGPSHSQSRGRTFTCTPIAHCFFLLLFSFLASVFRLSDKIRMLPFSFFSFSAFHLFDILFSITFFPQYLPFIRSTVRSNQRCRMQIHTEVFKCNIFPREEKKKNLLVLIAHYETRTSDCFNIVSKQDVTD